MPIPLGILAAAGAGAAGGGGAFDLLETTVLGSSASSVTFSSLSSYSAYKHLQIRYSARSDRPAGFDSLVVTLNGDTGANYSYHFLEGNASSVVSGASTGNNFMILGYAGGNNTTANVYGAGTLDIFDFNNSSKKPTLRSLTGIAASITRIAFFSGLRNATAAAVTSINLSHFGSNFVSGSRFSLYGIKG